MANYMREIAKMLGVELGEKFKISNYEGYFYLNDVGFYHMYDSGKIESDSPMFMTLLNRYHKLTKLPWKPKFEEKYYSVGVDGSVEDGVWLSDFLDYSLYKLGNCYRTPEEARVNRSKWGKFYDSDEVLTI